jgi:cytochrome c553
MHFVEVGSILRAMFENQSVWRASLWSASFVLCVPLGVACSKREPAPTQQPAATAAPAPTVAAAVTPDPAMLARRAFQSKCVVCHGDKGAGDGPGAVALNPKPRAYSDAAWQASVTDEHIRKIIVEGGAAVGKSPGMPPNPDLNDKPEVVAELVKIVRSFKKD